LSMMMSSILFVCALILFVTAVDVEEGVNVLTDQNFDEFVASHPYSLIEFYASWCQHCKNLAPVYSKTAEVLVEMGSDVPLAKVDCTVQKRVCEQNQIQGYPTLKLFKANGDKTDYEGERNQASIIQFILKKTGPPSHYIKDIDDLTTFQERESSKVIGWIEETSDLFSVWNEISASPSLELFAFGHLDKSLWGDQKEGHIDLMVGKESITYTGTFDASSVINWVLDNGFPLVEIISQESWNRAQSHPTSKYLLAVFFNPTDGVPPFIESVASIYKNRVVTTVSDSIQILERWGGSGTFLPTAVLINFMGAQPDLSTWDEESGVEFNAEGLKAFIDGSIAGTYKSNIKSEDIPDQSEDDPVTVLVAKNFEKTVNDTTKDIIFVEFYAPWCGHCKKLAPIYDELGEHFKGSKNVVIAKIDATQILFPKNMILPAIQR